EQVLKCLLAMASRAETTRVVHDDAEAAIRFFRTFADRCHHKKEEEVLFPALAKKGLGTSVGPVAVMLQEHEIGRGHVARLDETIRRARRREEGASDAVAQAARAYADLLLAHIGKEDHILFPLADQVLQGADEDA